MPATPCHIGLLLFPKMTQIDFAEPFEVFARLPDTIVHVVAKTLDPVRTDRGLVLVPTVTCADCPPLDVVVVPGGPGQHDLTNDEVVLGFLRRQAARAQYVTSVCTGALALGAAGLLFGYRATTHWLSVPLLELYGAIPVDQRVVVDGNRVTCGVAPPGSTLVCGLRPCCAATPSPSKSSCNWNIARRRRFRAVHLPPRPRMSSRPFGASPSRFQQQRREAASRWRSDWMSQRSPVLGAGAVKAATG